jgi:excisionase family DNA binding protein
MFTEREVAERLNCKVSTLRKWRLLGKGLTYRKIGRLVRYSEADLVAFLEANRVQPTGGAQ